MRKDWKYPLTRIENVKMSTFTHVMWLTVQTSLDANIYRICWRFLTLSGYFIIICGYLCKTDRVLGLKVCTISNVWFHYVIIFISSIGWWLVPLWHTTWKEFVQCWSSNDPLHNYFERMFGSSAPFAGQKLHIPISERVKENLTIFFPFAFKAHWQNYGNKIIVLQPYNQWISLFQNNKI